VWIGESIFALAITAGALKYPGGTWYDRGATGHQFWSNFWCDLLNSVALNGIPNPGAPWARMAFAGFSLSLASFWWLARRRTPSTSVHVAAALGWLSAALILVVMTIASASDNAAHDWWVSLAGLAGITAASVGMRRMNQGAQLSTRLMGTAALALALLNLLQFLRESFFAAPEAPWLAGVQKLATLFVLLWMALTSRVCARSYA